MTTNLDRPAAVIEPLPDPPGIRDIQQDKYYVPPRYILGDHFSSAGDVLVAGQGYLIESRGSVQDWALHFYPDCVVAFGVDPETIVETNGYVISEAGKPPDFVIEVASKTTAARDFTVKREGYAALGVSEYWRFDGSGNGYYPAPLAGDLLVGGSYRPAETALRPNGETWGYSPALSLYLCAAGEDLRFWDPVTEEYLPTRAELREREIRAVAERNRAMEERDAERVARVESERRNADLEAENARLRKRLGDA